MLEPSWVKQITLLSSIVTNIRLDWNWLPVKNTPALYGTDFIMVVKRFYCYLIVGTIWTISDGNIQQEEQHFSYLVKLASLIL